MPIVKMPDGTKVRFPDDMPKEQIRGIILQKFPDVQPMKPSPEQQTEIQARIQEYESPGITKRLKQAYDLSREFDTGLKEGLKVGGERALSGLTLGGYDWASNKLGLGAKERKEAFERSAEQAGVGGIGKAAEFASELGGGGIVGIPILKGVQGVLKNSPRLAKVASIPLTGAVEGGVSGGFNTDSLKGIGTGAAIGGAVGSVLGGVQGAGRALLSTRGTTKNVVGGLENAVYSKEGARLLRQGTNASDDVAEEVLRQSPEAIATINKRTADAFDKAIGRKIDISKSVENQKARYADFIQKNENMPVLEVNKGYPDFTKIEKGFTPFQSEQLGKAIERGAAKTNAPVGSLGYLNEVKKELGDMIEKSKISSGFETKATADTVHLNQVKKRIDDIIAESGLKKLDKSYSKARNLEDAYQMGIEYNPQSVKKPSFDNLRDKKAFVQGIYDKVTANPELPNISEIINKNKTILKEVLPERNYKSLEKTLAENSQAFKRVESIGRKAESKLTTPEKGRFFGREQIESKGSTIGAGLDYLLDIATGGSKSRGAQRILKPTFRPKTGMRIGDVLTPAISRKAAEIE